MSSVGIKTQYSCVRGGAFSEIFSGLESRSKRCVVCTVVHDFLESVVSKHISDSLLSGIKKKKKKREKKRKKKESAEHGPVSDSLSARSK